MTEAKVKMFLAGALAVLAIVYGSMYTVSQSEQALVIQFGEPVDMVNEPGLYFKRPFFLQNIVRLDRRVLNIDLDAKEVTASDQKRLIVDAFAKYRITDPLKFYQTVRDEQGIQSRLNAIIDSRLRAVLGSVPLSTLLTGKRPEIIQQINEKVNAEVKGFGIEVVDVRIMRADLPEKNSQAIFQRMQTEREREAKEFRAQGAEEAQRITSKADKDRSVILAEAERQSQVVKGEGDAEAAKIFADAFGRDVDFYTFYRSLQAYRQVLEKENTTLILSPDSDFLRYLENINGN